MRDGTGLLTRDVLPVVCTFPPFQAVACRRPCSASLTVAGQWRNFTALPVHPVSGFLLAFAIYSIVKTRFLSGLRSLPGKVFSRRSADEISGIHAPHDEAIRKMFQHIQRTRVLRHSENVLFLYAQRIGKRDADDAGMCHH
jgi:hypothetical protein